MGVIRTRKDYIDALLSNISKWMIAQAVKEGISSYNADKKNGGNGFNARGFDIACEILWKAFDCCSIDIKVALQNIAENDVATLNSIFCSNKDYYDAFLKKMIEKIPNLRIREFE